MSDWYDIPELTGSIPWVRAMMDCAQDPAFHAEGDVWTHTTAVRDELEKLPEFQYLSSGEKNALRWAAILHDVGKPATTEPDEAGVIRSPKHAIKGMRIARKILRDLGMPVGLREVVVNLVRYHSVPMYLVDDPDPTARAIRLSWETEPPTCFGFLPRLTTWVGTLISPIGEATKTCSRSSVKN